MNTRLQNKMPFEDALKYTDESTRHCKEILSFLRKKQLANMDYSKALFKTQPATKSQQSLSSTADVKLMTENTHLWRVFQELNEGVNSIAEIHVL